MKKLFKFLFVAFVIFIVLIGLAVTAIYVFFPPSKIIALAEQKVEEATKRDVTIGSAGVKIMGGFGFKLNDFTLASPAGFEQKEMLKLKQLAISAELMPLLHKEVVIKSITLIDLEAHLVVKADSSNNFTFGDAAPVTEPKKKEPLRLPVTVDFPLIIENANITYDDRTSGQLIRLSNINQRADIKTDQVTQEFGLGLSLTVPEGQMLKDNQPMTPLEIFPLSLDTKIGVKLTESSYEITQFDLKLGKLALQCLSSGAWGENAFKLNTFVLNLSKTRLEAKADLPSLQPLAGNYSLKLDSELDDLTRQLPLKLPVAAVSGKLTADFHADAPAVGEENIAAILPEGKLALENVYVTISDKMPRIEQISGELNIANKFLNVTNFAARIGQSSIGLQLSTDLKDLKKPADWESLVINYALTGNVDLAEIKQQAPADFPLKTLAGKIILDIQDAVVPKTDLADYSRLVPNGKVTISNVQATGDSIPEINNLNGEIISNANGTVQLQNFNLNVAGDNRLDLSAGADLRQFKQPEDWEKVSVNFNLKSNKLDLNKLLPPSDPNAPPVMPQFPGITINGGARVGQLLFQKFDLRNVDAAISLKDRIFKIDNMDMDVFSGHVNYKMALNSKDTTYAVSTKADKVQSNDYITMLFEPLKDRIFGQLFFTADVTGKGMDPMEIKNNIMSNGTLRIDEGKLANLELLKAISKEVKIFNFDTINFNKSDAKFKVENGRFFFDTLTLRDGPADYTINGNTSFDGELDFSVRTLLSKAESDKINFPQKDLFLDDKGRFIIDLKLVGKGTSPRITWDKTLVEQKAKEKVQQVVDEKTDEAKKELEKKGKDLLKGLFGK